MTGPKRDDLTLARDRAKICDLLMKGYRPFEIVDIINADRPEHMRVSRQTIENDIKFMEKKWLEAGVMNFDAWRHRLIESTIRLEKTYWDEFEKSKRPKITKATEAIVDSSGDNDSDDFTGEVYDINEDAVVKLERQMTKKEMREGNVAYLQGVQACRAFLAKLIGLDVQKIAHTDPSGQHSAEGAADYLKSMMDTLAERGQLPEGSEPKQLTTGDDSTDEDYGD